MGHLNGSCSASSCPTYASGVVGTAAQFNGVSSLFTLGNTSQLGFVNSSFTMAVWLQV